MVARHTFPPDLFFYEGSNNAVVLGASAAFRVWTARTGGTDVTGSMTQIDGVSPLTTNGSGDILADADGVRPWMMGPDDTNVIYVEAGGERYPVYTNEIDATYATLPKTSPPRHPLTGMVHASAFGLVSDGVTDNSNVFDAIATAVGGLPAEISLAPEPGGKGIICVSRPIIVSNGQRFISPAIGNGGTDNQGFAVTIQALAGFTGDAVFQSSSWTGGGGGASSWHWANIEGLRINCDNNCNYGIAIYAMGEDSTIRRVLVQKANDSNIILAGAHAPATLEHVSVFNATNYGVKLTTHPAGGAYTGNSGAARFTGLSGDNNGVAHLYIGGAQSVHLSGWKSEFNTAGVELAGSGTPNLYAAGYDNGGGGDVFKITGGSPRIAGQVRAANKANYVNDTVNSVTVPLTGNEIPAFFTYNGKTFLGTVIRSRVTQTRTGNGNVQFLGNLGDFHEVTLAGNATSASISNGVAGQELSITYIQDGTGGRTYVWPTANYAGGAAPANIATAGRRDTVRFMYDGTAWSELSRSQQRLSLAGAFLTPARSGRYLTAPPVVGQSSNGAFTLDSLRYMPVYFDRDSIVAALAVYIPVAVASSTVRLGLYADSNGQPTGAALVDAGTVDSSTTGTKEITGLSVAVSAGLYWVAAVTQGAAAQMVGVIGVSPGIAAVNAYQSADTTCWVHSASVSGALPTANPNSHGRGMLVNVKIA